MDASDRGLAVLDPARRRYVQVQFDVQERADIACGSSQDGFSINIRELFCVALAASVWGQEWAPHAQYGMTFVRAWSDNASAVAWVQSMSSVNPLAQELIRAIGLAEATYRFRVSTRHLPGSVNIMADAASRAWTPPYREKWTKFLCWSQTPISPRIRKLYKTFSTISKPMHWPTPATESTQQRGASGAGGAQGRGCLHGSPTASRRSPHSSSRSQCGAGDVTTEYQATQPPPFCPRLATSVGIIGGAVAIPSGLHPGHQLVMQGMSRLSPPPRRKRPVSAFLLRRLRSNCDFSTAHDRVLWGAAVVGFFFLLRRSEYLTDRGRHKHYALQRKDVTFWTREGRTASALVSAHTV